MVTMDVVELPGASYSSSVHQLSNTKLFNYSGIKVVVKVPDVIASLVVRAASKSS